MGSTTIPRGNLQDVKEFAVTLTPASVPANTTNEQSFTILGLSIGDYINGQCATAQTAGVFIANVRVTATNTISIQFANCTGGALTPVSGSYGFIWGSPENLPLDANAL